MPRTVRCSAVECIHNADGFRCAATNLILTQRNIHNVYEGRKTLFECKGYEQSEEHKDARRMFDAICSNIRGSRQKEEMDG